MATRRRADDAIWWVCVAFGFWPIGAVPFVADEISGVLVAAFVILLAIAVAFALRRRWAWWVLLAVSAVGAVTEAAAGADAVWWAVALNAAHVGLLLTPAVRRRIFG